MTITEIANKLKPHQSITIHNDSARTFEITLHDQFLKLGKKVQVTKAFVNDVSIWDEYIMEKLFHPEDKPKIISK